MGEKLSIRPGDSILDEMQRMHDRIMKRAYDIFTCDGSLFGRDMDDRLQAERELVWRPAVELTEKDGVFRLELAASGIDPKDFNIEVTPEDILIKADLHHEHTEEKGEVHLCEFAHGNLFRSIHLPRRIDTSKVEAEFKNGLLTLKAPVAEEARARTVAVEAA